MQFIKDDININFIGRRKIAVTFSLMLILISIVSMAVIGPKYGIDFAGGSLIQVKFDKDVEIKHIKQGLSNVGLEKSNVQRFGKKEERQYLIRTNNIDVQAVDFSDVLKQDLFKSTGSKADIQRVEMVGPQIGNDLKEKALFALFYALLFIIVYISGRFEFKWTLSAVFVSILMVSVYIFSKFNISIPFLILIALIISLVLCWYLKLKYAMGAIVALIHDVTITVGIFTIMQKEFTLPIVAALLTIVGYSLNDTIIVFDRIREQLRHSGKKNSLEDVINTSINKTLSRTVLTSLTTLVVVLCLFLFGGGIIHDFAFAVLVGILVGTYSSIFIASPILIVLKK